MPCRWRKHVCACGNAFELNDICDEKDHDIPAHEHRSTIYLYHEYVCEKWRRRGIIDHGCDTTAKGVDGYAVHHNPEDPRANDYHRKTYWHHYALCGCNVVIGVFQERTRTPAIDFENYLDRLDKYMDVEDGFAGAMQHIVEREVNGACVGCIEEGKFPQSRLDRTVPRDREGYRRRAKEYWNFDGDLYFGPRKMLPVGKWQNFHLRPGPRKVIRDERLRVHHEALERQRQRELRHLIGIPLGLDMAPEDVFRADFLQQVRALPSPPPAPRPAPQLDHEVQQTGLAIVLANTTTENEWLTAQIDLVWDESDQSGMNSPMYSTPSHSSGNDETGMPDQEGQ